MVRSLLLIQCMWSRGYALAVDFSRQQLYYRVGGRWAALLHWHGWASAFAKAASPPHQLSCAECRRFHTGASMTWAMNMADACVLTEVLQSNACKQASSTNK